MHLSRDSVVLWVTTFGLALAGAVPAGATVRTATYSWAPATGPVTGYLLFTSVDGGAEELYSYVSQPNAVIEVDSGASVILRVAAFDAGGRSGPRSDSSSPLRLCPGDFDGDEIIDATDVTSARSCMFRSANDACSGADMNDDGIVTVTDFFALAVGANACPEPAEPAPPARCMGDMDGDGVISWPDIYAVKSCLGLLPQGNCTYADLDGSGFITNNDLILVNQKFGMQACSN